MPKTDSENDGLLAMTADAADNTSPRQDHPFWVQTDVDATRWDKSYPFQLLLVKADGQGGYTQDSECDKWTFTLPLPPQALSMELGIGITGSVTQGGYQEEHNGIPTRNITLSGSLGVMPLRPAASSRSEQSIPEAIFAGTIEQVNRVSASAQNVIGDVTGSNPNIDPQLVPDAAFDGKDAIGKTTGEYQMRLLLNWFENYGNFKLTTKGRDYRLALALWKQQAIYLVTPLPGNGFSKVADSPFEWTYRLAFRAWRRISLDRSANQQAAQNTYRPSVNNPNKLAASLKAILDARDVLENARDILSVLGGDLDHALFEPLRQLTMFARDAINSPLAFADLPVQVLASCKDAVVQYLSTKQAFTGFSDAGIAQAQRVVEAYQGVADAATSQGIPETGIASQSRAVGSGNLPGPTALVDSSSDPGYDPLRNPQEYYELFKAVQPGAVSLPPSTIKAIAAERDRTANLTRLDFEQMRDRLVQTLADYEASVGLGHAVFDATYSRPQRTASRRATRSDYQCVYAMNKAILEANRYAATQDTNRHVVRPIDVIAGLASRSGIAFRVPRSKFAVPFPYGATLEQLAMTYLGDPDRWFEIVALNGLRAPYVDEEGYQIHLSAGGVRNQVVLPARGQLQPGQLVVLGSSTQALSRRRIVSIDEVADGLVAVELDGDPDLDRYVVRDGAYLHAWLPDTVNSQMTLYMPSDRDPATGDSQTKAVPGLDSFDQLLAVGGFDLLLTPDGDLVITPDGDGRLAIGLANIVQTARLRLSVPQGSLNRHPSFGLPVKLGQSTADLNAQDLLRAAKNLFVDDSTFEGVTAASVQKTGPAAKISIAVKVRGVSQLIPITVDLVNR